MMKPSNMKVELVHQLLINTMRGSNTKMDKPQTIYSWTDSSALTDVLYRKSWKPQKCTHKCMGSMMDNSGVGDDSPLTLEKKIAQAKVFMDDYYADQENHETPALNKEQRLADVLKKLEADEYYDLTEDELVWGARTAWRNAPRCPARVIWKKLTVFDCRHMSNTDDMFNALCRHLVYSLNEGNIQPAISIFRERRPGHQDVRVWNNLLIGFAGYRQEDGSIIGDPSGLELTEFAESMGWRGAGGMFDVLPWVLNGDDGIVHMYDVPEKYFKDLPMLVDITHPTINAIGEMGLKWLSLPGVSSMMYEVGGVQFTASPFSGWYQETEIASRDLLDVQRYNLLEPLGIAMGLDMSSNVTLWKDIVALELNLAVLESYKNARVSIVDHYTQAEQFMEHMATEYRDRGGCSADWVWIVPPQSGSLVPTYHQEMIRYNLSPSYEYQQKPWLTYGKSPTKTSFRAIAWTLLLGRSIYQRLIKERKKVVIVFATETSQSKRLATHAMSTLMFSFRVNLVPIDAPNVYEEIKTSDLSLFITSTFGNGSAPTMAEQFNHELLRLAATKTPHDENAWFKDLNFAVFGLGSSAYLELAAFGKLIDSTLVGFGCRQLVPLGIGDELKNQKGSFQKWISQVFSAAAKLYNINVPEEKMNQALTLMNNVKEYKWHVEHSSKKISLNNALSTLHKHQVVDIQIKSRSKLHQEKQEPDTLLLDFVYDVEVDEQNGGKRTPGYEPGDHLGIYPSNDEDEINQLKNRLSDCPPSVDDPLKLLESTNGKVWSEVEEVPQCLSYDELLKHVVDLRRLPSQDALRLFLDHATSDEEKAKLKLLIDDDNEYSVWSSKGMTLCNALDQFPSVMLPSAQVIGRLPTIQSRLYSIASAEGDDSRRRAKSDKTARAGATSGEVSLVVGVVKAASTLNEGQWRLGLCSGNLQQAALGSKMPAFFRKAASFKLPVDPTKPVIMIAAGSGIAPFRSFWQERHKLAQHGEPVGPTILLFGCRKMTMNLLNDETESLTGDSQGCFNMFSKGKQGIDFTRFTAFSRVEGQPKQYVQELVTKHAALVKELWLELGGSLYVCGKVSMARGIEDSLQGLLQEQAAMNVEEAKAKIQVMRTSGRYQEDIFTS